MAKKRYTPEQIVAKLRQAEVELAKGQTTSQVCKKLGISEQSYYRWRREYGGLTVDQAKRLKDLEKENAKLRRQLSEAKEKLKKSGLGSPGGSLKRTSSARS